MFKSRNLMKRKSPTSSGSPLALSAMTPVERAVGRFMRAPDHAAGDTGAPAPAADTVATEAAAAPAGGDVAADGNTADQVTSPPAGDAEAAKPAEDGKPADAATDKPEGSIAGDAGEAPAIDVLGAPETYEVKPPEGVAFDAEAFDLVAPELKALNLSNDAAQKLVDVYAGKVVPLLQKRAEDGALAGQEQRAVAMRKEWADESRKDPEIGGVNFDETVDACARVWDKFGIKKGEGIRQLLDDSGLGNHPDMLRFLSRVAKGTGEGDFVPPEGVGADTRPIWDRVYGQPETAKAG